MRRRLPRRLRDAVRRVPGHLTGLVLRHLSPAARVARVRLSASVAALAGRGVTSPAGEIQRFANPGAGFEPAEAGPCGGLSSGLAARAKTIAFYLPQFHAFEQNDAWWGKGFSEWRNVARGTPRFEGHYQPRIPRDLGFYDLNDASVLHEQARLARANGIEAFCFYYYWFDGQRLMERPLDRFLEEGVDQDFCIMWANENWTRTWDGFDSEVLIEQNYREQDEADFIADTARYMGAPRYVRVQGRPLFILYRPGLLPDAKRTLARWRRAWTQQLGVEPWILMVQGFGDEDPRPYGLDGAVEFPPHKVCVPLPEINDELTLLDPGFRGHVRSYPQVIASSLDEPVPEFALIKTVVPHWDNDARREGRGMVLHGSTPALYERWLDGAIERACAEPFEGEPIVFVNAWNEWAESAYLEPDVHYGHAYLNATRRAVYGLSNAAERQKVLLVGHDAYRHGAQMLLLNIARTCARQFGLQVHVLLKEGGPLLPGYREVASTRLLAELGEAGVERWVREAGLSIAICNTSVTGDLVPGLRRAGVRTVSLIHELPRLIEEYELQESIRSIGESADHVVFPSEIVARGFRGYCDSVAAAQHLRPQGSYEPVVFDADARRRLREQLGLGDEQRLVINVGYADLRKGFDRFLETARRMREQDPEVHFAWVGALSADMQRWVAADMQSGHEGVHLIGYVDGVSGWYSAADALYLTSREDPYPTVVLEAMNVGLPALCFEQATGLDKLLGRYGRVIGSGGIDAAVLALREALAEDDEARRQARRDHVEKNCRFDDYCFELLQLAKPDLAKVSVVVPNYNYAGYMASRLGSVFDQTQPIFELIVLDDASSDDSLSVIDDIVQRSERIVNVVPNERNSGNVFRQWRKGCELARGELLWIAEADDLADARFLARSVASFRPATVFSVTDSKQIDTEGRYTADSYDYYFRTVDGELLGDSFDMDGKEFVRRALSVRNVILNVSAVLWRRDSLSNALQHDGASLEGLKLVGDWRLYLQALHEDGARISWIAEALNTHRRHASSVTHALEHGRHLQEIEAMHARAVTLFGTDRARAADTKAYISELRKQFGLSRVSFRKAA